MQSKPTFKFKITFKEAYEVLATRCCADYNHIDKIKELLMLKQLNEDEVDLFAYHSKKHLKKLMSDIKESKTEKDKADKNDDAGNETEKERAGNEYKKEKAGKRDEKEKAGNRNEKEDKAGNKVEKAGIKTNMSENEEDVKKKNAETNLALILLFALFYLNPFDSISHLKLSTLNIKD
jgi:hypothetical protein